MTVLTFLGLLASCSEPAPDNPVLQLEERYHRLTSGEGTREAIDSTRKDLITAYVAYVDAHPQDSLAVLYLDWAAMLHSAEPSESLQAIRLFERLIEEYSDSGKAAEALFMKAYVLNNSLQDYEQARIYYQQFLDQYPDHGLASDARNELEIMGIPIEDIFDSLPIDSTTSEE